MLAGCAAAVLAAGALAHEVRPAYLRIEAAPVAERTESGEATERYDVLWKQPLAAGRLLPLAPVFPDGCEASPAGTDAATAGALARRFALVCPRGLRGGTVAIDGLQGTITDVMLHVTLADGTRFARLLKPAAPAFVVGGEGGTSVLAHLALGIEHLLFGFDHILFVVALLFFVPAAPRRRRIRKLVETVTAFTVAHSVTLGVSALGWLTVPQAPVEAVIALSILFLVVEKLRGAANTLTANHTWVVAFAFGLLHGFGFAGALADIGLPRDAVLASLFLFNVGVEIGQLAVVAAGLALAWLPGAVGVRVPPAVAYAPLYAIGVLSAYWFVGRTVAIVV